MAFLLRLLFRNQSGIEVSKDYKIKSVGREGLDYHDGHDVHHFDVAFINDTWVVYLPATKGKFYESCELNEKERAIIFPRIKAYLEGKRHYSLFGRTYPAIFEREGPVSDEMLERRRRAAIYLKKINKGS
jgi:hypothetical protein